MEQLTSGDHWSDLNDRKEKKKITRSYILRIAGGTRTLPKDDWE